MDSLMCVYGVYGEIRNQAISVPGLNRLLK
jgi:hypothetical protein